MGTISAGSARRQVKKYKGYVEDAIEQTEKNFVDMDFENANRRDEMEDIINEIKQGCEKVLNEMNGLWFEE